MEKGMLLVSAALAWGVTIAVSFWSYRFGKGISFLGLFAAFLMLTLSIFCAFLFCADTILAVIIGSCLVFIAISIIANNIFK